MENCFCFSPYYLLFVDSALLRKVAGRRQRDNRDGKGRDKSAALIGAQHALPLPLSLPQRPCSSAGGRVGAVSGIAFNSDQIQIQGKQSIASARHSSLSAGKESGDCSKMVEGAECESDGIVAYCGLVWRFYVKALSCMVTMADRDVLNAQEMSSTVSAFQAARESKAIGRIADGGASVGAGAGTGEGEGEGEGGLKNYADNGSTDRLATDEFAAVQMGRISERERERDDAMTMSIPVRQSMGCGGNKEMPGSLIEVPGSVQTPVGHGGPVQVQGGSKGALLFMSLVAPDKTPGVLTQALRLLYKHPLETAKCLSTLTEAIMLDRGWNVRTSPLKVLLRLLTPFLQLQQKGKGKGKENVKANEVRRINAYTYRNDSGSIKCISSGDEERRSKAREEEEAEVKDALLERKAFLVAVECLRKVISLTSHHSSQILRLGGPSSSSASSSSFSSLSSTVCNEASVAMGAVAVAVAFVGAVAGAGRADHPSAVGGILISLLQSRPPPVPVPAPAPSDLGALDCSPALSTLRDCMAYERALKGAQCTVALFDGLRDLLSLSTPPIVPSTTTTADSRLTLYLSGNITSTDACQAVAEHGLFAQRAGSPEGGITRTPALEVLQCMSRLPQCFLLLDAAHSFSLRRQQTGVRVGIREGFKREGKEEEVEDVMGDGVSRGIDEQRLNAEVLITLEALVSAWQLGVNAIGRYFTVMEVQGEGEVEGEGAEGGVTDVQQDSQRSSFAFSQLASQRFTAGRCQYGVSQQVCRVQVEVNTLYSIPIQ